jgi:hypothetical protein
VESSFLDVAHRIGHRLSDRALWEEDTCTWMVMTPDYDNPDPEDRSSEPERASGGIYQGTAGIALFLGELYRHTQDEQIRETANGAIQHALSDGQALPHDSFGFHGGRVGIAHTAARLGRYFERPGYVEQAVDLLAPLDGNADHDEGVDVIAGAAGAIPALLQLAEWIDSDRPGRLALALGESLIERAVHEPIGWSWGTLSSSSIRHLTGYAHGASGIGHAFLELYHATGASRYHYAAEQAFLYERQFLNDEVSNWPDFRYNEFGRYQRQGWEVLRDAVRSGEMPPPEVSYMSAWCHGAPGIGLARLRAYDLLGHDLHAEEAETALEATKASLDPDWNYSLCHGIGGNCETLLYAASVLEDPSLREQAEEWGERGKVYARDDSKSWPCGTVNAVSDPSLLLGEAGIGYFYLRLHSAETPSCLFLRAPDTSSLSLPENPDYRPLQRDYVSTYFETTLGVFEAYDGVSPSAARPIEASLSDSDVRHFQVRLDEWIASDDLTDRDLLRDATRLDRARLEMQQEIDDFTKELLESIRRPNPEEISWERGAFERAEHTQLVEQQWAWRDWIETAPSKRPPGSDKDRVVYLLHRSNNRIRKQKIGVFAELVFRSLDTPKSLPQIEQAIRKQATLEEVSGDVLRQKIIEQLMQAHEIGAIRHHQQTPRTMK